MLAPSLLPLGAPPEPGGRSRIELCGSLVADIGGRRVDALLPGRKGRQLFACLVISRNRPISRDELIEVIWPSNPPTDPEGTLSTLLTRLRGAVGHGLVRGRSELVLDLGADAWVDWDVAHASVFAAEQQLGSGNPRAALKTAATGLEIARRPLLPGISTPWLEDRRRELGDAGVSLLDTSVRAAMQLGVEHLPLAERSARELIEREPYRESAYALLMESHAARGNVAEALRVYDDLRRLLREELGLTPSPLLTTLAERLLDCGERTPRPALPPAPAPLPAALAAVAARPLVGRRAELRRLVDILDQPSGCRVVTISGEDGIGKSRLATEVAVHARDAGFAILHGRAQRDGVLVLQPFVEALRGYLSHSAAVAEELLPLLRPELVELSRMVPTLRPAVGVPPIGETVHLQRFADAATAVLIAASRHRPLLLVLDDLHLADRESLLLLRHLTRAAAEAPVIVLALLRDGEAESRELRCLLLELHREGSLERVLLGALDAPEVTALLAAHGVSVPSGVLDDLLTQAGGNPFYLEELLIGHATGDALPPSLRAAMQSRLEPLPQTVRDALAACAAIGHAFDVAAVVHRTGASRAAIVASIAHAVRAGLLVSDSRGRFAFRHGLIRQSLVAE